jgi:hypothetical protein
MENSLCWICGNRATTSEHNPKRSDLKLIFSTATFQKGDRLIKTTNAGKKTLVQGLNSKELKYQKNLCEWCNNSKTAPHDKAREILANFLVKNSRLVLKEKQVNLKMVYGRDVKRFQSDLFKYFAKAFGCAINATGKPVPNILVDVINGKSYGKDFFVTFSVDEELLKKRVRLGSSVGCSNLEYWEEKKTKERVWIWSQNLGWFVITYFYKAKIVNGMNPWYGKNKVIQFSI